MDTSMKQANVSLIASAGICSACGACTGCCPKQCISMRNDRKLGLIPQVDNDRCNSCGICLRVCHRSTLLSQTAMGIHGSYADSSKTTITPSEVYIAHSCNERTRLNGSSGGIATEMLMHLLETGKIQGAIVVSGVGRGLHPQVIIAKDLDALFSGQGSKYQQVALGEVLAKVKDEAGPLALVGLPCQIRGFKNAQELDRRIRGKIVIHIGLFCFHAITRASVATMASRLGVASESIHEAKFRSGIWPGRFELRTAQGETVGLPFSDSWREMFSYFSVPFGCLGCREAVSPHADISLGDPWIPEALFSQRGSNLVLIQTDIGRRAFESILATHRVKSTSVPIRWWQRSLSVTLRFKALQGQRLRSLRFITRMGYRVPDGDASIMCKIHSSALVALAFLEGWDVFRIVLMRLPRPFLRLFSDLFHLILTRFCS